jgi:hypothetical protein
MQAGRNACPTFADEVVLLGNTAGLAGRNACPTFADH